MREAAEKLDFEKAIELRDAMEQMKKTLAHKLRREQNER
jgi:excinuclease UvrABC helicase subunit UvrB